MGPCGLLLLHLAECRLRFIAVDTPGSLKSSGQPECPAPVPNLEPPTTDLLYHPPPFQNRDRDGPSSDP